MSTEKEEAAAVVPGQVDTGGSGPDSPSDPGASGSLEKGNKPSSVRLVVLFAALALAVFCGGLDSNVVAPAIPTITNTFNRSEDQGWYGTAYYLSLSCCQMAWAQLHKAFPAKPAFFGAFVVFEVGVLLAALAPSSTAVIVARVISGAGISGSFVGSLIIISYIVPLRWRPIMSAFFSLLMGSTQTAGPVLGGALTSRLSWRWCFWINLPIGGLSMLLALLGSNVAAPKERQDGKAAKQIVRDFDWVGFVIWALAVICLTLILELGGVRYPWASWRLVVLYVLTPLLFGAFVVLQVRGGDRALAPTHIITQRSLACCSLYVLFMHAAKSQLAYFLPIFFQAAQGVTALESGVDTIPSFLSYFISQALASVGMSWLGYYTPFMLVGSAVGVAGTALLRTMTVSTPAGRWIGYQILAQAGFGIGFNGPEIAAQTVFQDPRDTPIALTIVTTCMDLGGSLGTSIGSVILWEQVKRSMRQLLPDITTQEISEAGITGLLKLVDEDQRPLVAQAYADGIQKVFYGTVSLAAATLVLACFVEWRSVKHKAGNEKHEHDETVGQEKS